MEERVIIRSEVSNVIKRISRTILIIGWAISILIGVLCGLIVIASDGIWGIFGQLPLIAPVAILCGGLEGTLISSFLQYAYGKSEMTVTNKRVYGKAMFGKRVDIPLDSISAVGTSSSLKGISVASSSGRLTFTAIANNNEIHNVISRLLLERQSWSRGNQPAVMKQGTAQSNADELKKYKELLDGGVITREEFDAKKKQLLNL